MRGLKSLVENHSLQYKIFASTFETVLHFLTPQESPQVEAGCLISAPSVCIKWLKPLSRWVYIHTLMTYSETHKTMNA